MSLGQPGSAGGTVVTEYRRALSGYCRVEHLFVERQAVCDATDWGDEPVTKTPFALGSIRWWQLHRRMDRYDLYHYLNKRYIRLTRYGRKPALLTCHGLAPLRSDDVYTKKARRRFRKQLRLIHHLEMVIANSKHTAADLMELLDVPAEKIEVIHFGVNHEAFAPRPAAEAREKLGIPPNALVILNIGTERAYKNIDRMLDVFSLLRKEFDNLYLVRVGDKTDRCTRRVKEMKLSGRVLRPGRTHNPAPYYNAADVYLCMDLHASFGLPNIEAMASGCPVVSSNIEAIPEIVSDACILVDPRNTDMIVDAARSVLTDSSLRDELKGRGLKRAAQFTWEKTAEQTAEIYSKILTKRETGAQI